ncbi:MAG: Gldg family protein [Xanthomonadales bacterium]|nr:Gldg family protein [Xanthomonadales bacterium]MCB1641236.1 Gldg family protein [Xanthomonadales bacterium]
MNRMNRKLSSGATLALLIVLFVAGALLITNLFRGARLDLTANNQYTLSDGTLQILDSIDEPVSLKFYFSEESSRDIPAIRTYAGRVKEMLEEMAARADGKLRLSVIDPKPFSEEEDEATSAGLQAVPTGLGGQNLLFGLVGSNATTGRTIIPFFQPDKETFLEYDIAKLVQSLVVESKPVIGLISSLPVSGGFDPTTRQMSEPWAVIAGLRDLFEVRPLGTELTSIDETISVLLVIHPKELSDNTQYAIDQFVLRGGRLLAMVDPQATIDQTDADPNNPTADMFSAKTSDLPKLFAGWGIEYDPAKVVADRRVALQVSVAQGRPPVRHPLILGLTREQMNQQDVVSAELDTVNLDTAGHFRLADGSALTLEPLLQSSNDAMLVDADRVRFLPDPSELMTDFTPSGENYVLAARVSGPLKTAFPDRSGEGHLAESSEPVQILLFGDVDMASNRLWVQVQNFFGQQIQNPFANNGDLLVNGIDNIAGSGALISVRGRGSSSRPFTVVQEMKRDADDQFRAKQQQLEEELRETERNLTELQQAKGADSAMILSGEQQAELLKFQQRRGEIRKELRAVQRSLDAGIESLGTTLKFINIALVPLLVIGVAIFYANVRSRRRRQAAAHVA